MATVEDDDLRAELERLREENARLEREVRASASAARESAAHLRAIVELSPMPMAVVAVDGAIEIVNQRAVETFGYAHAEIPTMDAWSVLAYPDAAYRAEVIAKWTRFVDSARASGKEIQHAEYRVTCKDGTVKQTEIFGVIVAGKVLAIFDDKNERRRTDEKLRESQALLLTAFENSPLLMTVSDLATGRYLEVNDTFCRVSGYGRDEAVGQRPVDLGWVGEDEHRRMLAALRAHGAGTEVVLRRKSGEPVVCRYWGDVVETPDGQRVFSVAEDVTLHKQHEAELHDTKATLLSAFDNSPLLMSISSVSTGKLVRVNDAFCRVANKRHDELVGKSSLSVGWITEPERARLVGLIRTQGKVVGEEVEVGGGAGAPRFCRVWAEVVRGAHGDMIFTTAEDITDRKAIEGELEESNSRLSAVVEGAPIGIVVSRLDDGTVLDVNDAALRLYGYAREEVLGRTPADLGTYARSEQRDEMVRLVRERGRIDQLPIEFRRRDGTTGVMEMSGSLIDVRGARCLLTMLVDVTERVQAERAKANLAVQLQHAQKMESVGRLAGGVAHDFNNMLGVIIGRTELALRRAAPTSELRDHLEEIRGAAKHSADLTRQLLAFARRQTVAPKVLDLNDTVQGMLAMLQRLIGENVRISWVPADRLWPVHVDPSQIDQILANLCVNARDAIATVGDLVIETKNVSLDARAAAAHLGASAGDYVCLVVRDSGCGMSDDVLAHIFEPFFTTKEVGKGTGLGLATVYGIVEQNHGFIAVRSRVGAGTTVSVHFPRYAPEAEAPPRSVSEFVPASGRETILLVEDEQAVLKLTKMMLEEIGYVVLAAGTTAEALRIAAEHRGTIDLLLTDVVMPEMNGRELAERVAVRHPRTRCLFMSGYTADVIATQGLLDDRVHFLQKPFTTTDLATKVREVLESPVDA